MPDSITLRIAGEAGQGVTSSGAGFAKVLARGGFHVFGLRDYMSRIRGGHNSYQIRVAKEPLYSHADELHLLIALGPHDLELHVEAVDPGGGAIYDEDLEVDVAGLRRRGVAAYPIPLRRIAEEEGGRSIMANTAALGAAAGLARCDFRCLGSVIRDNFASKGQGIVDGNLAVARRAYDLAAKRYSTGWLHQLAPADGSPRPVMNGNQAFCLGALLAGCRFVSAYPMTPSTSVIEWMSSRPEHQGILTKHTEDEIAAVCMAIGASHVGLRSMTATSGGGFSLMTEALGLAAITETPLVILEAQRPGPSTGMATRTEQGDLLFALHASQGEFPRIVLTPGTVEQCFEAGWRSFNLADRYQCPVIVMTDNFLANSLRSIEWRDVDFDSVRVDRGEMLPSEALDGLTDGYRRYAVTDSGVSPRVPPGHPSAIYLACSVEHDEHGNYAGEDPGNRVRMNAKRLRKLAGDLAGLVGPTQYGVEAGDVTLVGWGSSYGPLREAVDRLTEGGTPANLVHFGHAWPFPADAALTLLDSSRRLVVAESNATGQFADLLRAQTGIRPHAQIHRYDGRPLSPSYVLDRL